MHVPDPEHPLIPAERLAALAPLDRLKAVDEIYGERALLLASMQKTSGTLIHMISRIKARTMIVFVDTQFHFKETLDARDEFIRRYGVNIHTVFPEHTPEEQLRMFGRQLYNYVDGQPECCEMRKEKPFLKIAREMKIEAVINGLMRDEGNSRKQIRAVGFDPRIPATVYSPIFDWSEADVDAYSKEHDLPVHPLYAKAYASIGCEPCTTPIAPGEEKRAGRWRHLRQTDGKQPEYCGINFSDLGQGI